MTRETTTSEQIRAKIDEWGREVEQFGEKIRALGNRAAGEAKVATAQLEVKRRILAEKIAEARRSSGQAWEDVQKGVVGAWEELKSAYADAKERFR